jgi:hypothetical protein
MYITSIVWSSECELCPCLVYLPVDSRLLGVVRPTTMKKLWFLGLVDASLLPVV